MRWLYFLSFALVIGSLAFRLVCLRGLAVPPAVEKRIYALAAIGVVGAIELGIVGFCLRSADVLQLPFGEFIYGDLSPISGGTRFGTAFVAMTLGCAAVATLRVPRVAARAGGAALAGARALARVPCRALAVRPQRRRSGLVVEERSSPTGCISRRRRSGSAGSSRSPWPCGSPRRTCDARRSCASHGSRWCWSRS